MRTNPFYDAWLFLIGNTNEHRDSGIGGLLTALFLLLLVASVAIACINWKQDVSQRTKGHLATWFMRVMIGTMWYQGSIWKLPLPVTGGFRASITPMSQYAAFDFFKWIVDNIFLHILPILGPLVFLTEMLLAVSYILGFLVRPFGVYGMLYTLPLWIGLYRQPEEWPWLYVFLIFVQGFFVVTNAGKSLGLDGVIGRSESGLFIGTGLLARLYRMIA
jgi:hypothetical protein